MRRLLLIAVIMSVALSSFAQKKKESKRELPDQVLAAQFVYVTGWHGDLYDPRVPIEERNAIARVQNAIQDWGRYKLAYHTEEADIMLVVKVSHLGMVQGGVGVGGPNVGMGTPPPPDRSGASIGNGPGYGVEIGSQGDYLMVSIFPKQDPTDATYVWKRSSNHGLQGRKIALVEEFKQAVADSERAKAAAGKP